MKSRPEKVNASEGRSSEASSVKNQAFNQGFNVLNSTAPTVAGTSVHPQASRPVALNMLQSVRPKDAASLLGIGVSTIWAWVKKREGFPKPRKLSSRCTVFDVQELVAWRDAQKGGSQ